VEHIFDAGTMPWLRAPVAVDILSSLWAIFVARRLVWRWRWGRV